MNCCFNDTQRHDEVGDAVGGGGGAGPVLASTDVEGSKGRKHKLIFGSIFPPYI